MRKIIIFGLICLILVLSVLYSPSQEPFSKTADKNAATNPTLEQQTQITSIIDQVIPTYVFVGGGSGVIISEDGYVLTNYHVIGTNKRWMVYGTNEKSYQAEVVGYDPQGDLALLKIKESDKLPFIKLGDSDGLQTGQPVLAIGNPFGLGIQDLIPSVTLGIISALHRYQEGDLAGRAEYADAIQTDTPINPGNSGGPLINLKGELVGINGRIEGELPFVRANTGIGYAIPANQIKKFLPYLKKGGKVFHGQIGGLSFSPERVASGGVKIAGVRRGTQAREIGLKQNDILIEIAGEKVNHYNRALGIIASLPAGESITLKIRRAEEIITVTTILEERE